GARSRDHGGGGGFPAPRLLPRHGVLPRGAPAPAAHPPVRGGTQAAPAPAPARSARRPRQGARRGEGAPGQLRLDRQGRRRRPHPRGPGDEDRARTRACRRSCGRGRREARADEHGRAEGGGGQEGMRTRALAATAAALYLGVAAPGRAAEEAAPRRPATGTPTVLRDVGFDQRLGAAVPLDIPLRDEGGAAVRLRDFFGRKPVVLNLVYYDCPMLCNVSMTGLASALDVLTLDPGKDFEIVTV